MPLELRFWIAMLLLAIGLYPLQELLWRIRMIRKTRALFRKWDRMIEGAYFVHSDPAIEEWIRRPLDE